MFATVQLFQYCWSSFLKEILCTRPTVPDIFLCSLNVRLNSAILFSNEHFKLSKKYVSSLVEVFELGTEVKANYITGSFQDLTKQEDLSSSL
jgi:hypothetical protein